MGKARKAEDSTTQQPSSHELRSTEPDPWFPGLRDAQAIAVDLIVSGLKYVEVAAQVGISPEQLWRWRQDPVFQAALSQRRAEMHRARADRFWKVTDKALGVAEESLDERDPQMATDILRIAARGMTDIREMDAPRHHDGSGIQSPALNEGSHGKGDVAESPQLANEAVLTCSRCGFVAKSSSGLTRHERLRHGNGGGEG
jgi:hypothetical protein